MESAITRVVGVVSFGLGVSAAGALRARAMETGEGTGKWEEMWGRGVLMMAACALLTAWIWWLV